MIENYIQYAVGYQKDNINILDIKKAINDLSKMDDEHSSFWVGVISDKEYVLEVDKEKHMFIHLEEESETKYTAVSWVQVEKLFEHLLSLEFEAIKKIVS